SGKRGIALRLGGLAVGIAVVAGCSGSGASWTPVSGFPDAGGAMLVSVAAGPASFVTVGTAPAAGETNHAAIWTSPDGKSWTRSADDPSFSQHLMNSVASGPSGFMAVGGSCASGECFDETVWTSTDGQTWHQAAPLPVEATYVAVTRAVVAGGPGWIVGGWRSGDPQDAPAAVWTTVDGTSWTEGTIEVPADATLGGTVGGIAVSRGTDVAVGTVKSATSRSAAVWTSADSTTWKPVPADASFTGSLMSGVVVGGPGFVAVGRDDSGAAVWVSTDGSSWKEDPSGPGFAGAQMSEIAAHAGRLVAVGYDGNTALVWTSTDGVTWSQSSPASDMAGAQAIGVAVGASADVVVGSTSDTAKAWTGSH
ncbi:MAG: hypothetical protein ACHQ3P_10195, partial [Candidatus Limnocylindrales bacterium]